MPDAAKGLHVRIVGRKSGLLAWLLSLIGIDATTVFEVFDNRIVFKSSNLSGALTTTLPLASICRTSSGYFKPVLYLVLGVMTLPLVLSIIGAIVPILFFVFYFLHKSLLISIESNSGSDIAIAFKQSVIEGISVGEEDAEKVVTIVNQLLLGQHDHTIQPRTPSGQAGPQSSRSEASTSAPRPPTPDPVVPGPPLAKLGSESTEARAEAFEVSKRRQCPTCSTELPAGAVFCESCGTRLR